MTNVRMTKLYISEGIPTVKCPFCNYAIYSIEIINLSLSSAKKNCVVCANCGNTYRIKQVKK